MEDIKNGTFKSWEMPWGAGTYSEQLDAIALATKQGLMKNDIIRKFEEEYAPTNCDGIYFQSFTELDTDNINGMTSWWWGREDKLEIKDATKNWEAIDAQYAKYDKVKIDYPYGQFVPEVDDIQAKIQNVNEQYNNYMKQISFGKYTGTAEEIVAEMQKAMKQAGIEEVTAALQAQFDALYK